MTTPEHTNFARTTCAPPVLFLDFDGVTHPEPCVSADLFRRLPLIEAVVRERELRDIDIVISSSWKDHYSLSALRGFFSPDVGARVLDVSPTASKPGSMWLPGHSSAFERQWEIEQWLKHNRPWGTPWVAIDDRDYWFEPGCPHLLLTHSEVGFTPEHAPRLRDMLWERL